MPATTSRDRRRRTQMIIKDALLDTPAARRLDTIGRALLWLATVATLIAFIGSFWIVADASDDRIWVEFWRTTAYGVFAGLFAMLALAPRTRWGVWELVFAQKVTVTAFGLLIGNVNEA